MGDLPLDAPHLRRVVGVVRLHGHGERFPGMAGIQSHGRHATRAHSDDSTRRALHVGGVDVAPGHDDDVLGPAAHHDVALLGEVSQVPGVEPALVVLGGHKAGNGDVSGSDRISAHLNEPHPPRRLNGAILIDDAGLDTVQQGPQRGEPAAEEQNVHAAYIAGGGGHRPAQHPEHVGVHLVDDQPSSALRKGHRDSRFGHSVRRQYRLWTQAERRSGVAEVHHIGRVDLFRS